MIEARPHPAKFSPEIRSAIEEIVKGYRRSFYDWHCHEIRMLDPMAGVNALGWPDLYCVEMEPEWAIQCGPRAIVANAAMMPYRDETFDLMLTSPAYATRMADTYDGRDGSTRHTYRIDLGRPLKWWNAARMQWGEGYKAINLAIIQECWRVLKPKAPCIVNISDHIRGGEMMPVTDWWRQEMSKAGFLLWWEEQVATRRQRHGANGGLRAPHESILVFTRG